MVLKKFGQKVELSQKLTPLESPVIHYAKSKAKLEKIPFYFNDFHHYSTLLLWLKDKIFAFGFL